jgi:uncharacterized protein YbbC (DUF1343 family)
MHSFFIAFLLSFSLTLCSQSTLKTGAEQPQLYLHLLKGKKVGVVTNQSAQVGAIHLVDFLLENQIKVERIFSPEHGFRGQAEAGELVNSNIDPKTGIKIVSLYGANKKPKDSDLEGLDIVVFDIQDVGVRFYTYTSTLHYVMEVCAKLKLPIIVLDRPNPNGSYVDGNIPDMNFKSFVCMHPVPIVHGLTIGEYAKMIAGEGWMENSNECNLTVIACKNYDRKQEYVLPIAPSPNLNKQDAIYLYSSLCLFEGTQMSLGRGTDFPFQVIGHPDYKIGSFTFTPQSIPGFAANPPFKDQLCFGFSYQNQGIDWKNSGKIQLEPLIQTYQFFKNKPDFFIKFFDTLAGGPTLREQIVSGLNEAQIRQSWEPGLSHFKEMRKKYLIY